MHTDSKQVTETLKEQMLRGGGQDKTNMFSLTAGILNREPVCCSTSTQSREQGSHGTTVHSLESLYCIPRLLYTYMNSWRSSR